jgi:hypothetical protein
MIEIPFANWDIDSYMDKAIEKYKLFDKLHKLPEYREEYKDLLSKQLKRRNRGLVKLGYRFKDERLTKSELERKILIEKLEDLLFDVLNYRIVEPERIAKEPNKSNEFLPFESKEALQGFRVDWHSIELMFRIIVNDQTNFIETLNKKKSESILNEKEFFKYYLTENYPKKDIEGVTEILKGGVPMSLTNKRLLNELSMLLNVAKEIKYLYSKINEQQPVKKGNNKIDLLIKQKVIVAILLEEINFFNKEFLDKITKEKKVFIIGSILGIKFPKVVKNSNFYKHYNTGNHYKNDKKIFTKDNLDEVLLFAKTSHFYEIQEVVKKKLDDFK